jgi:hypothetical protein
VFVVASFADAVVIWVGSMVYVVAENVVAIIAVPGVRGAIVTPRFLAAASAVVGPNGDCVTVMYGVVAASTCAVVLVAGFAATVGEFVFREVAVAL